jgi:CRISPR-associated protein Csm4
MSDTFFGHFCWALLYKKGESYLTKFLELYDNEHPAPVLFSSGFPSGYLPRPALPSLSRGKSVELVGEYFGKDDKMKRFEGMSAIKASNKLRYLSIAQWRKLKDGFSEEKLCRQLISKKVDDPAKVFEMEVAASNVINRISGTVLQEGGLFQREKAWYHEGVELDLYAQINNPEMKSHTDWFLMEYLPENGFGADKSTGMGNLSISLDETFNPDIFHVEAPNARLSLSLASFHNMEKYDAHYRLTTKYGKLGGTFAVSSPTGGNPKPFKKPVLMYEPGAVFFCTESLNNMPLLKNVHSDERIRHCGIPLTLPVKMRKDDLNAIETN